MLINSNILARPFEFDKHRIMKKAVNLFWRQGYFNTSAQNIVDELKLSRSSIYNSFKDKRTLFLNALNCYIEKESGELQKLLSELPSEPKSLETILIGVAEANFKHHRPKGCLIVNTAAELADIDQEVRQIIESNILEVKRVISDFVVRGQYCGKFTDKLTADQIAELIFNQITAMRIVGKVIRNSDYFKSGNIALVSLISKK